MNSQIKGHINIRKQYDTYFYLSVVLFIAMVIALVVIPFNISIKLNGIVKDKTLVVNSPYKGVLKNVLVSDKQTVVQNQGLFAIDIGSESYSNLGSSENQITATQDSITKLKKRKALFNDKIAINQALFNAQISKLNSFLNDKLAIKALYSQAHQQQQALFEQIKQNQKALSYKEQLDMSHKVLASKIKLNDVISEIKQIEVDISQIEFQSQLEQNKINDEIENVKILIAQANQQLNKLKTNQEYTVVSPNNAVVATLYRKQGDYLDVGDKVLTLTPEINTTEIYIYANTTQVGELRVGQKANIRYSAYSYLKYGTHSGSVTHVSKSPLKTNAGNQPIYLIKVAPDNNHIIKNEQKLPLINGSAVDVRVIIEQTSALAWVYSSIIKFFE